MLIEAYPFNWKCANVLIDPGSSFSSAGGEAFVKAAEAKNIKVDKKTFKSESKRIEEVIEEIVNKQRCKATVVFGEYADYSALLREAHKQRYRGEWIMGSNFGNGVDTIRYELKKYSEKPSEKPSDIDERSGDIDEMLNGLCGFT